MGLARDSLEVVSGGSLEAARVAGFKVAEGGIAWRQRGSVA